MMTFNILVVNPKDKETQIAVYDNYKLLYMISRKHSREELSVFPTIYDQVGFRRDVILKELKNNQFDLSRLKIVISRGGLIHPVQSGVFEMNSALKRDLFDSPVADDVINIAGLVADEIASGVPEARAMICDPTVVDELQDVARMTGSPDIRRVSIFHALNQKAIAKLHAESQKKKYNEMNLIVAHMGNGTTVGAHRKGRVVDVNQGLEGDGPFSLVRPGTLPVGAVVKMCYTSDLPMEEMLRKITRCGGILGHLGTTNINLIEDRIQNGDEYARLVMEAMSYQVIKNIGAMYFVLKGEVDAILLTGEVANSKFVVNYILQHVEKIAPTYVYPGDNEIKAMAQNALRVLNGDMEVQEYK